MRSRKDIHLQDADKLKLSTQSYVLKLTCPTFYLSVEECYSQSCIISVVFVLNLIIFTFDAAL